MLPSLDRQRRPRRLMFAGANASAPDQIRGRLRRREYSGRRAVRACLMPRALAAGRVHLDAHRERALFTGLHRADADQAPRDFLAAFVADRQHHRIFPRAGVGRIPEAAFDAQRRQRGGRRQITGRAAVTQLVVARRTNLRAFQDCLAAVRAGARGACRTRLRRGHLPLPLVWPLVLGASDEPPLSSQPNSAWPRMREPLATLKVVDFTSPVRAPVCSSSTCAAVSMLPVSSPAIVTRSARTLPLTLAPCSMVRSPRTLMSPLKRPAMRTWPAPSILPSITRSGAICDSDPDFAGVAAGSGLKVAAFAAGAGCSTGSGMSKRATSGGFGSGDDGDLAGSFHRAMTALRFGQGRAERTAKSTGWEWKNEQKNVSARGIVRCFSGVT